MQETQQQTDKAAVPGKTFKVEAFGRPEHGFNRGGHWWSSEGSTRDLTEAQLDLVKAERRIRIIAIDGVPYRAPPLPPPPAPPRFDFEPPQPRDLPGDSRAEIAALNAKLEQQGKQLDQLLAQVTAPAVDPKTRKN